MSTPSVLSEATGNGHESFGLFSAAAVQDPYPYYQRLRENDPIHWSERAQAWIFTRYKDVFDLQMRTDLSVDRVETLYSYLPSANAERFSSIVEHYTSWLLYRDDTYHDRLKALFMKAMTPRAVEALRPKIVERVERTLGELREREQFDAYLDFAARIPVQVMLDLLGLPQSDENMIRQWSDRCSNFLFQPVNPDSEALAVEQRQILDAQQDYLMPFLEERRRNPRADMLSAMLHATVDGQTLSGMEILATCNMMMTAGGGTSRSAISLALWRLQQFPHELARLKQSPVLINQAAEEFLRFEAPTQRGIRTARVAFDYDGHRIESGQIMHLMLGAANRDPHQFDNPDELILTRNPNRHVTLGHGVHYCLGASLARMELRVAVEGFLRHFPDYRLVSPGLTFGDRTASRRPIAMPVYSH
jgi:cytochrome P450